MRAQELLRRQAVTQSENLLTTQHKVIERDIQEKETRLKEILTSGDNFTILLELALHSNSQSDEFRDLRNSLIQEFNQPDNTGSPPPFDEFIIIDPNGSVKISSRDEWQGQKLDMAFMNNLTPERPSYVVSGFGSFYGQDEYALITALEYKNSSGGNIGTVVGITSPSSLTRMLQPFYGLYPFADTYFILPDKQVITENISTGEQVAVKQNLNLVNEVIPSTLELRDTQNSEVKSVDTTLPNGEAALTSLKWIPELQLGVALEVNYKSIYGEVRSLASFTITLALVSLIATVIVIWVGRNRVIQPLHHLALTTKKFSDGDWSERARVNSDDEIGMLATSFNQMADELSNMYQNLEDKVEERTRQVRTAAEVAQNITTLSNIDEMLNKTVELLVKQFGYYQASIFIVADNGRQLNFKTGYGTATAGMTEKRYAIEIGSGSIMGWVSANNKARVASDVREDTLHLKNALLPETRSEATVPISIGNTVLGVLDVQSTRPSAFTTETVAMLQTLASQIAIALQTSRLSETTQINIDELSRLYRSSKLIAEAESEGKVLEISEQILKESPYSTLILAIGSNKIEILSANYVEPEHIYLELAKESDANTEELRNFFRNGPVIADEKTTALPQSISMYAERMKLTSTVYLPIITSEMLVAIIILGSSKYTLSSVTAQPYASLADLASVAIGRLRAEQQIERHLQELESLSSISEAVSSSNNLTEFFQVLREMVAQTIGDYSLTIALYDARTNTINIPYSWENEQVLKVEPFPLGEGLTSILIHSRQPLMLVENTERRAAELGAKIQGKPARSWMGVPLLVKNEAIGAMIIQDADREFAFDEDDLKFFNSIAGQVAGAINNVHLLEDSQQRALQLETAAEISRDISGSLNLDELLIKAVNLIHERFNFYHAAVFLLDLPQEFAVIREATGEAGAQMKRANYKIGVGSKSTVGYVTGRGEQLVVHDTTKDATHSPNSFLPETRAEAAIPLRVGDRILGALDVQSTQPYAFTDDNLRSLQILADQIAIAVVNTELFAETQEHLSQHRLLHHITTTVASGSTLEEALESAVNGLQVTLGGDRVIIFLVDRDKRKLEVKASVGYAEDVSKAEVQIGSGITGWVAQTRRPLRIKDVREDPRYIEISSNTRSELAIPLVYRNELLGVLNVESEQTDAYNENDEEMLGTLGGSLAAIIANARLLEQIRTQAERERLVNEVTGKIRRSTDIQSILTTTASELTRITGAVHAKIEIVSKPEKKEGF